MSPAVGVDGHRQLFEVGDRGFFPEVQHCLQWDQLKGQVRADIKSEYFSDCILSNCKVITKLQFCVFNRSRLKIYS